MLEIRKTAIALDEKELLELERIVIDGDEKGAGLYLVQVLVFFRQHRRRGH